MGIMDPATSPTAPYRDGRLHSRPGQPPSMAPLAPGVHNLEFPDGRSALIYAPLNTQRPMSLYVQLHGVSGLHIAVNGPAPAGPGPLK